MSIPAEAFIKACNQVRFLNRDLTVTSLQALIFTYVQHMAGKKTRLKDIHDHLGCSSSSATRIVQSHLDEGKGTGLFQMTINPEKRSERMIEFTSKGLLFMRSILEFNEDTTDANHQKRKELPNND